MHLDYWLLGFDASSLLCLRIQSQHNSSSLLRPAQHSDDQEPTMDVNAVDKENVTAGVSSGEDGAAAAAGAGSFLRDFLGMTGPVSTSVK